MARISLRPQTQIVLQVKARTLEVRIVPGDSKVFDFPIFDDGCGLD